MCDADMYELPEVHPSSLSHSLAKVYGFSTHVIAFGTSYFQRLAACDSLLLPAALTCPDFAPFVQGIVLQASPPTLSLTIPMLRCDVLCNQLGVFRLLLHHPSSLMPLSPVWSTYWGI